MRARMACSFLCASYAGDATDELFTTPGGSNDDWYWLYAAVTAGPEGKLITNDELRDHVFQMLPAPRLFYKWKERHQGCIGRRTAPTPYSPTYVDAAQCCRSGSSSRRAVLCCIIHLPSQPAFKRRPTVVGGCFPRPSRTSGSARSERPVLKVAGCECEA